MSLFLSLQMYYNYINERVGIVFRNRYKSQPILSERQLINCIKYIFNNPVRAKMVLSPEEYIYSNFQDFKKKDESNNILDEIYKKINHSIEFPKVDNGNLILKSDFLDTAEDKETFIKELISKYENEHNLTICRNKEDMESMVKYIKKKVNVSNIVLAEILQLSKSTIVNYLKS